MYIRRVILRQSVDIVRRVADTSQPWWNGGAVLLTVRLEGGMEGREVSLQTVISIQKVQVTIG